MPRHQSVQELVTKYASDSSKSAQTKAADVKRAAYDQLASARKAADSQWASLSKYWDKGSISSRDQAKKQWDFAQVPAAKCSLLPPSP